MLQLNNLKKQSVDTSSFFTSNENFNDDFSLDELESTEKVLEYVINRFNKENNIELRKDKLACARVEDYIEQNIDNFNKTGKLVLNIPYFTRGNEGALHLNMVVEKQHLNNNQSNKGFDGWLFDDVKQDKKSSNPKVDAYHNQKEKKAIKHITKCPLCGKNAIRA